MTRTHRLLRVLTIMPSKSLGHINTILYQEHPLEEKKLKVKRFKEVTFGGSHHNHDNDTQEEYRLLHLLELNEKIMFFLVISIYIF